MENEACPVVHIHKVTDSKTETGGKCPVPHATATDQTEKAKPSSYSPHAPINQDNENDIDEFPENPSYAEYKKIKRVMGMITKFYASGSLGKKDNYDQMTAEIEKLDADLKMVEAQLEALEAKPSFNAQPKKKEYKNDLLEEKEGLLKQKDGFIKKQNEFKQLSEWSNGIVKVCEWLERNLEQYCLTNFPDLPEKVKQSIKPMEEISLEKAKEYAIGLDEIVYNLKESQDFFEASVDGRLKKYHNIEKEIIEHQLEAIRKFPEDNVRRQYIEAELLKDLEYVTGLMDENEEVMTRRHKMLKSHRDFLKVLAYNKERLAKLGAVVEERHYDPKFNHYNDSN